MITKNKTKEINDGDVVNYLLIKEIEISSRIHNAVTEILRLGYESERGNTQVPDMIESIRYILEDIERVVNR